MRACPKCGGDLDYLGERKGCRCPENGRCVHGNFVTTCVECESKCRAYASCRCAPASVEFVPPPPAVTLTAEEAAQLLANHAPPPPCTDPHCIGVRPMLFQDVIDGPQRAGSVPCPTHGAKCSKCGGSGRVNVETPDGSGIMGTVDCGACSGSGHVPEPHVTEADTARAVLYYYPWGQGQDDTGDADVTNLAREFAAVRAETRAAIVAHMRRTADDFEAEAFGFARLAAERRGRESEEHHREMVFVANGGAAALRAEADHIEGKP